MTISVPQFHYATSLNYISHLQNSISKRTNTLLEKVSTCPVKYQSVQRNQLLFLVFLIFKLTLEVCADTWGGQGNSRVMLRLRPAGSRRASMRMALVFSFYIMSLLQCGDHKCNHANEGLLGSEPSLQTASWWWCQHIMMACLWDIALCHASKTGALSMLAFCTGQIKHLVKSGHIPITNEVK